MFLTELYNQFSLDVYHILLMFNHLFRLHQTPFEPRCQRVLKSSCLCIPGAVFMPHVIYSTPDTCDHIIDPPAPDQPRVLQSV